MLPQTSFAAAPFRAAFGSRFLVEALIGFGNLRCIHRAEFRPTHGTEFRFLVAIVRQRLIVHLACSFGIERCRSTFLNPCESHFVFGRMAPLMK